MGRPRAESAEAGLTLARQRKTVADARLSELLLREREGSLVPIEAVRHLEALRRDELRARLLAVPGKWAPRVVNLRNIALAQAQLEELVNDTLEVLRETGAAIRDRLVAGGNASDAALRRRGRPRGSRTKPKAHRKRVG